MGIEYDLGHDHYIRYFSWKPDNTLSNRERYGTPLPSVEKAGLTIRHPSKDPLAHTSYNGWCRGAVYFDIPEMLLMRDEGPWWQVLSWEPLTLTPSLRCRCGDHGFITAGKWVPS